MHERSLVQSIIEQVGNEMRSRRLGRLHEIQLQIGEFSGVEPRLVESAFAEMSPEVWDMPVRLVIEVIPLTATCQTCKQTFQINNFRFVCPTCGTGHVTVIGGEEMRLVNLLAERRSVREGIH